MKITEKKKPVPTIPKGVWESEHTDKKEIKNKTEQLNEITTDAQGNGYPISNKSEQSK